MELCSEDFLKLYIENLKKYEKALDASKPLEENYVVGPYAAGGIFYEVRKCFKIVDGTRRNVKVLRKEIMT